MPVEIVGCEVNETGNSKGNNRSLRLQSWEVHVDYGDEDDIKVEITKLKRHVISIGEVYWVNSDHFMLAKDNSVTKLLMEGKE